MKEEKTRRVTYPRPAAGTRTGRVWEIADRISEETGSRARRCDVLAEVEREAGNAATASTQYHYWKSNYETAHADSKSIEHEILDMAPRALKVASDGRLVIPREMREAMLLGADGHVTARIESGELRMVSRDAAIRHMQQVARSLKAPGISVVDEFLAERRALWGQE